MAITTYEIKIPLIGERSINCNNDDDTTKFFLKKTSVQNVPIPIVIVLFKKNLQKYLKSLGHI